MIKKILTAICILASAMFFSTPTLAQHRGGGWHGGWHGGYHGGYHRGGDNWWIPGAIVGGAILGSALIYNGVRYNDAVAYCSARYRSYNPGDGTYLGSDGYRHPCP